MGPYVKELEQELSRLETKAKANGALAACKLIDQVRDQLTEVGGKDFAGIVIQELREEFGEISGRRSETRRRNEVPASSMEMDFDADDDVANDAVA